MIRSDTSRLRIGWNMLINRTAGLKGIFMMKTIKKAVYTVEAAVIVPVLFMLLAVLIFFFFHVHNRTWYEAAAYEAALVGNSRPEAEAEVSAGTRARERVSAQIMPGSVPETTVTANTWGTQVTFRSEGTGGSMGVDFSWAKSAKIRRVHPAGAMRKKWMLTKRNEKR